MADGALAAAFELKATAGQALAAIRARSDKIRSVDRCKDALYDAVVGPTGPLQCYKDLVCKTNHASTARTWDVELCLSGRKTQELFELRAANKTFTTAKNVTIETGEARATLSAPGGPRVDEITLVLDAKLGRWPVTVTSQWGLAPREDGKLFLSPAAAPLVHPHLSLGAGTRETIGKLVEECICKGPIVHELTFEKVPVTETAFRPCNVKVGPNASLFSRGARRDGYPVPFLGRLDDTWDHGLSIQKPAVMQAVERLIQEEIGGKRARLLSDRTRFENGYVRCAGAYKLVDFEYGRFSVTVEGEATFDVTLRNPNPRVLEAFAVQKGRAEPKVSLSPDPLGVFSSVATAAAKAATAVFNRFWDERMQLSNVVYEDSSTKRVAGTFTPYGAELTLELL